MSDFKRIKCPNCGADVKANPNSNKCKCEYCGTEFIRDIPKEIVVTKDSGTSKFDSMLSKFAKKLIIGFLLFWILGSALVVGIYMLYEKNLPTEDPFKNISIEEIGASGYGEISVTSPDDYKYDVRWNSNLKNGDTVTIKASTNKTDIRLSPDSMEYKVSSLLVGPKDLKEINNENLASMNDLINDFFDKEKFFEHIDSDVNRSYNGRTIDYIKEYVGFIILEKKDSSVEIGNKVCFVYKLTCKTSDNYTDTIYVPVFFSNVLVDKDGNCNFNTNVNHIGFGEVLFNAEPYVCNSFINNLSWSVY